MTRPPQSPQRLRIFLSSPGDVAEERALVRRLVKDELPYRPFLRGRVALDLVSWDDPAAPTPVDAAATPQLSVNRFRPRPSDCDIVVVVLWSRMGTPMPRDAFHRPDGSHYLSGTEWEFEDALNADPARRPIILLYRRMEAPRVDLRDPALLEKQRQFERVEAFFARFRDGDGILRGGYSRYATPSEFRDLLESHLEDILHERLAGATPSPAPPAAPAWTGPPYPGLRAFGVDEAEIFFGRGREVDALVAALRDPARRLLAVVGASGTGKSSLVRAGLLPRLADGAIEGSGAWPVLTFTPGAIGEDPFLALAAELARALPPGRTRRPADLAAMLAQAPGQILGLAAALLEGRSEGSAVLLLVDQLEELFTLASERLRPPFAALLAAAAADPRLRVVATLRADFLPRCAAEPELAALLQGGTFVLGPPGPAALLDMIRRPAERAGIDLEDGLADEILRDAGGDPGALPLVAFCLEQLHRRTASSGVRLSSDAYRSLGGLRGAIGRRADELLQAFRASSSGVELDAALARLFGALVHVDATGKAARRRAWRDELMAAPDPVPRLVEELTDPGRLLLAEESDGRATVALAHEALLQEWPALNRWLERGRALMQRVQRQLLGLAAPEPEDRRRAAEALGEVGPAAPEVVPALLAAARDADTGVRRAAVGALGRLGPAAPGALPALLAALDDAERDVRRAAAEALARTGPVTAEAAPALVAALRGAERYVRQAAARALGRIDPAAAPAPAASGLAAALAGDEDEYVRSAAAEALGRLGKGAPQVSVPALSAALADPERHVRRAAAEALWRVGPAGARAATALLELALRDPEAAVRRAAIGALERLDPGAMAGAPAAPPIAEAEAPARQGLVPALLAALRDPERAVRQAAAEALGAIGAGPGVAPALAAVLAADPEKEVRGAAATALAQLGAAPGAASALAAALAGDAEREVRRAAAQAIGVLGVAAAAEVWGAVLAAATRDPSGSVRWAAAEVLGAIGSAAPEIVPALAAALDEAEPRVRRAAAEVLGVVGPAAADAAATLLAAALRDADADVRRAAAEALERIGPEAPGVVPALLHAAADSHPGVRQAAVETLGRIGAGVGGVVPALLTAFGDSEQVVRQAAAESLRRVGAAASEAVPALAAALRDPDRHVRWAAAGVLARIGPAAADAAPALLGATLRDPDRDVRWTAASALARIGPAAPEARAALDGALRDADARVRRAAAVALELMEAVAVQAT